MKHKQFIRLSEAQIYFHNAQLHHCFISVVLNEAYTSCIFNFIQNQLEKLEAARSAYLWLPLVTLLGITGPYSALLGLTRPYSALLGLTRPYSALLGLTGPYWALLSLTGPYLALLSLS